MGLDVYWRPIKPKEGRRLPREVKEALRQHPAYENDRAFWSALYSILNDNKEIKRLIDYLDAEEGNEIEIYYES